MPDNTTDKTIQILSEIKPPYVWIPYIILDLYGPAMKQAGWLYTILNRFKNGGSSESTVGVRTLAEACGIKTDTIQVYAKNLEELGLIKIIPGDRVNPTIYKILLPPMPPPPELVAKYYPPNWTPPERTKKWLKNILIHLGLSETPQEKVQVNVGVPPTGTPKNGPLKEDKGVPPGGTQSVGEVSQPEGQGVPSTGAGCPADRDAVSPLEGQYKSLITTNLNQNNNNPDVVLDSIPRLTTMFKAKDPAATEDDLKGHYDDCLEYCKGDRDTAFEYLVEKISVVLAMKDPKNPQAVLAKAILEDWKPTSKQPKVNNAETADKRRKEIEAEKERIRIEREALKKAPEKTIFEFFRALPENVFPFDKRLKLTAAEFEGNPIIGDCLERIKAGKF